MEHARVNWQRASEDRRVPVPKEIAEAEAAMERERIDWQRASKDRRASADQQTMETVKTIDKFSNVHSVCDKHDGCKGTVCDGHNSAIGPATLQQQQVNEVKRNDSCKANLQSNDTDTTKTQDLRDDLNVKIGPLKPQMGHELDAGKRRCDIDDREMYTKC